MRKVLERLFLPAVVAGLVTSSLATSSPVRAAITPLGQQGCPYGQVVGGENLVTNGDFSISAGPGPDVAPEAGFMTQLPNRGPGIYPGDAPLVEGGPAGGGFSIQTGYVSYENGVIVGRPFAGDPSREVPPSNTYFYSNPNINRDGTSFFFDDTPGEGYLWRQVVAVSPNSVYNFYSYFDNLIIPGSNFNDPVIELRVDDDPADATPSIAAGPPITVTKTPDAWIPIQYAFLTGPDQTAVTLEIWDVTGKAISEPDSPTRGDDFAMTAINLRTCAAAVGIAKSVAPPIRNDDGSFDITYIITVRNYGSGLEPVNNLQVTDVLTQTFANAGSFEVITKTASTNLTVNPDFSGRSPNTNLLTGTDTLDPNETGTISFTVRVTVGLGLGGRGPFPNRATVTANSNGVEIEDDSVPGESPDLDDNTNPKDPSEDEDTTVNIGTKLAVPFILTQP